MRRQLVILQRMRWRDVQALVLRRYGRVLLVWGLPALVLVGAAFFWLSGGRYATTRTPSSRRISCRWRVKCRDGSFA